MITGSVLAVIDAADGHSVVSMTVYFTNSLHLSERKNLQFGLCASGEWISIGKSRVSKQKRHVASG